MALQPGVRLGPYEILAPLGAGGMGEVWRARDTKLGRDVALKVLPESVAQDPERLQRFEREAQVLASLNHPHIAAIHGVEDSTEVKALVLELVDGETLAERIARGPIPVDAAIAIARQIADALAAAHEKGIVHRDLKPANVKLDSEDRVKVLDFGLAKALDPVSTGSANPSTSPTLMNSPTLTAAGTQLGIILGTAAYMAPEQARGAPVDKRADIFAFGCVVYEMLTGKRAFEGETVSDTLAAVLRAEADWSALPAATPVALRTLLERCLEKDRKKRLHDIGDAGFELDAAARPQPAPAAALARRPRHEALGWALAAGLAVALAIALLAGRAGPAQRVPTRSLHVPLGLPSGLTLSLDNQIGLAISPDGRRMAFIVHDKNGQRILLRDLDSLEGRVLDGTDGAQQPFFSPDGEWIGFFAGNQVKKIAVGGGQPLTVTAFATGQNRGATWLADGRIVFVPNSAVGLSLLPAAGGEAKQLTTPDTKRQERTHRWPAPLPNGKAVIFTCDTMASSEYYDDANIEAVTLATGERKVLVEGASRAVATADALIYARGGALYGVAFDADRLEVRGKPVLLIQGVATDVATGAAQFGLSSDGTLLYVPGTYATSATTAVWVDRAGVETPAGVANGSWSQLALAPDGSHLALSGSPGNTTDIWISDVQRGNLARLTFSGVAGDPVWTADGGRVAFSLMATEGTPDVYWKAADGSGDAELLWDNELMVLPRAFSPDGKLLVVDSTQAGGTSDLWILPLTGDRKPYPFLQSPFDEYNAEVSPGGRHLAYTSDESGVTEIYVRPFPQGAGRWQVSVGGGSEPRWSADGARLFYRNQGLLYGVAIDTRSGFVAGRPEKIEDGMITGGNPETYDVAPDGRRFVRLSRETANAASEGAALILGWGDDVRRALAAESK